MAQNPQNSIRRKIDALVDLIFFFLNSVCVGRGHTYASACVGRGPHMFHVLHINNNNNKYNTNHIMRKEFIWCSG